MARPLDPWTEAVMEAVESRLAERAARSLNAAMATADLRRFVNAVVGPKTVTAKRRCNLGHTHKVTQTRASVSNEELVHVLRRMEAEGRITRSEGAAQSGALWSLKEREGVDA